MLDLTGLHEPTAALLSRQLEQITLIFERQLASDLSSVNRLCMHVEKYRGKMLRPTLVVLAGVAARGRPEDLSEHHRIVAAVVEMIHMATLVHDDVLDEAEVRRRGATVNHLWGNETAVMLGDYLISNAFHLCSTVGDPAVNLALGKITNTLCEGELMQLHHREDYALDEATYFELIRRKTASLIGECCRLGAVLAGASSEVAAALQRFGVALGIAFQISDDLLDLVGESDVVGKSLGLDLTKGKLTLPLIHHITSTPQTERGVSLRLLEERDLETLRTRLIESGAVESSERTAQGFAEEAASCLPVLPPSAARDLLEFFTQTVVSRTY